MVNERWVGVAVSGLGRLGSGRVWQGWQGLAAVWRHTMGWGGVGGGRGGQERAESWDTYKRHVGGQES